MDNIMTETSRSLGFQDVEKHDETSPWNTARSEIQMTNHAFSKLNRRRNPTIRRILAGAIVSMTFAASLTMSFSSLAATVFHVRVAGDPAVTQVHTFRKDPVRIVNSVGVTVDEDDQISVTPINGGENSNVVVYRSGKAALDVDGEERLVDTGVTVADTIADSGVTLAQGDTVNVDLASLAYDGMEISIERAYDVFVQDGDDTYTYRTTGCKAGEAVYALGLTLDEEDELDVAPETELSEGDTVEITAPSGAKAFYNGFGDHTVYGKGARFYYTGQTKDRNGYTYMQVIAPVWIAVHDNDCQILDKAGK